MEKISISVLEKAIYKKFLKGKRMKIKRYFDFIMAFLSIIVLAPLILLSWLAACVATCSSGFFLQKRIGRYGNLFTIFKIRTMHPANATISTLGGFLRNSKMDEMPQLLNILWGDMSFVGPRPDIPGYADKLVGNDRVILTIRPGVTGLASLKYRNEEQLLGNQLNPLEYNDKVIWPDKVRINKWYAENHTFVIDIKILWYTVIPMRIDIDQFIEENSRF